MKEYQKWERMWEHTLSIHETKYVQPRTLSKIARYLNIWRSTKEVAKILTITPDGARARLTKLLLERRVERRCCRIRKLHFVWRWIDQQNRWSV